MGRILCLRIHSNQSLQILYIVLDFLFLLHASAPKDDQVGRKVPLPNWTIYWDGRVLQMARHAHLFTGLYIGMANYCVWRGNMSIASLYCILGWTATVDRGETFITIPNQNSLSKKWHRGSDVPGNFVFAVFRLLSY